MLVQFDLECKDLPQRLAQARARSPLKLKEICARVELSPQYWHKLEAGSVPRMHVDKLRAIERVLEADFGLPTLPMPPQPLVLHIDDEPLAIASMAEIFADSPYQYEGITSGRDGQSFLGSHAHAVAAIILDIKMAEVGGVELARTFARDYPDIPIVLLSGNAQIEDLQALLNNNCHTVQRYLPKPFSGYELVETVIPAVLREFSAPVSAVAP
ncbi:MAG: response regulator [Cyanobacteria bacterium J06641_5]